MIGILRRRFPYLAIMMKARLRGQAVSWGAVLALVAPPLILLGNIYVSPSLRAAEHEPGRLPRAWYAEGVNFLGLMQGILVCWIPIGIATACGREREDGRLRELGGSSVGAGQILLGLFVGPIAVELVWAAILVPFVLGLSWAGDMDWLRVARIEASGLVWMSLACVLIVALQAPRPVASKGHRIAGILVLL